MSKTKAQLEAELIAAKSEVIEWVMRHDKLEAALGAAYDELGKANKEIAHWFSEANARAPKLIARDRTMADGFEEDLRATLFEGPRPVITKIDAKIERMADNKPWRLIAIVAVVAFGLGLML